MSDLTGAIGANCKGSWYLGSACGRCDRCHEEARRIIPRLVERNKSSHELLDAVAEELEQNRRLLMNPIILAKAIRATLKD